jgi:hypothetical protein
MMMVRAMIVLPVSGKVRQARDKRKSAATDGRGGRKSFQKTLAKNLVKIFAASRADCT